MGVLVATGATRDAGKVLGRPQFAEPVELLRVPTYQVMGVIAIRVRRSIGAPAAEPSVAGSCPRRKQPG